MKPDTETAETNQENSKKPKDSQTDSCQNGMKNPEE